MAGLHGASTRAADNLVGGELISGKYGRLFPDLPVAVFGADGEADFPGSRAALLALAATMLDDDSGGPVTELEPEDENAAIAAGYTYLGQFIDHDISFDPSAISDRVIDPKALTDFRSPRFDLDSLYGRGPDDQPYLYRHPEYGAFHLGSDKAAPGQGKVRPDLVRNPDGRAVIGDPRNNENKLVTQVHALFLQFHNAVWDATPDQPGRFRAVRQQVRWHYQWLVVHDFLAKFLHPEIWTLYFGAGGKPSLRFYKPSPRHPEFGPYIPLEFSVAAYRLGHSMVRPSYALNATVFGDAETRIPIFKRGGGPLEQLNGFEPLPDAWGVDWGYFFPGVASMRPGPHFEVPQPSYRIDSVLVMPLGDLPDHHSRVLAENSLPALNLLRGRMLGLPSGQAVHRALAALNLDVGPVLTADELWQEPGNVPDGKLAARRALPDQFPLFKEAAPLWFYILREAEVRSLDNGDRGGMHLGRMGSAIVAETFAALLVNDPESYVNAAQAWTPNLPSAKPGDFTITDLINFVDARTPVAVAGAPAREAVHP